MQFELFHTTNRRHSRLCAASSSGSGVPTGSIGQHPVKVQVWGMFDCRALSRLQLVPQNTAISGKQDRITSWPMSAAMPKPGEMISVVGDQVSRGP